MATSEQLNSLLRAMKKALEGNDIAALRKTSALAIEATAMDDGEETFHLALVSHMLSKLISRSHYWSVKEKKRFIQGALKKVLKCIAEVENGDIPAYMKAMRNILNGMRELELENPRFVGDLEDKARTKLASRLYAQGFSLSLAVALTGAHKRDLMVYSGRTLIADRSGKTKPLGERLKKARALFSEDVLPDGNGAWSC